VSGRTLTAAEVAFADVMGLDAAFALRLAARDARFDGLLEQLRALERRREVYGLERRSCAAQN
jgi:hypothetical protein